MRRRDRVRFLRFMLELFPAGRALLFGEWLRGWETHSLLSSPPRDPIGHHAAAALARIYPPLPGDPKVPWEDEDTLTIPDSTMPT